MVALSHIQVVSTKMLHVQKFLRDGGSLETLTGKEFNLFVRRSTTSPNLVLLKYNQVESPLSNPLVQECRGLILDEADNWRVVCFPFKKFFNLGESNAAQIDWASARVQEKLDGTLCNMHFYQGTWRVSTSGSPDACGEVQGSPQTFAKLFWDTFNGMGLQTPIVSLELGWSTRYMSFMFELTGPENKIVVPYNETRVTLLSLRITTE